MNKRIKQLAEQCTRHQSHWMTIDNKPVQLTEHVEVFDKEKFAELIVKEAGEYLMRPEFIGRSDLDWSMILNEHFGVEE
jgi:hypothetical protein